MVVGYAFKEIITDRETIIFDCLERLAVLTNSGGPAVCDRTDCRAHPSRSAFLCFLQVLLRVLHYPRA